MADLGRARGCGADAREGSALHRLRCAFWWRVVRLYCRWWCGLRVASPSTVPRFGPVLVVARHTSGVDPLLLISAVPDRVVSFLIAAEYLGMPVVRRLPLMIGCIGVRREHQDAASVKAALRHLAAGKPLGVFLEGRIAAPEEPAALKHGAAALAARSGAPVVPVSITGTSYHPSLLRMFLRRHRAVVRFGEPIDVRVMIGSRPSREALAGVTDLFEQRIAELGASSRMTIARCTNT